jgi:hypothetical protein
MRLIGYITVISQFTLFQIYGAHLTDAQHSLINSVESGHFVSAPEHKALIEWADQENIYGQYGFDDIDTISPQDEEEIANEIGKMIPGNAKAMTFLKELGRSGLDKEIQHKLLMLAYINVAIAKY